MDSDDDGGLVGEDDEVAGGVSDVAVNGLDGEMFSLVPNLLLCFPCARGGGVHARKWVGTFHWSPVQSVLPNSLPLPPPPRRPKLKTSLATEN